MNVQTKNRDRGEIEPTDTRYLGVALPTELSGPHSEESIPRNRLPESNPRIQIFRVWIQRSEVQPRLKSLFVFSFELWKYSPTEVPRGVSPFNGDVPPDAA